jgi:1,6-anhydro-N-acetylmuramate kinase
VAARNLFVGLMSGTSLDGVDAALVELAPPNPALINTAYLPLPEALKAELHALQTPGPNELDRAARAGNELSRLYAEAVLALLKKTGMSPAAIRACGCHGQTIRHRPDAGYTLQIGNPALLAELTDISVVADFRSRGGAHNLYAIQRLRRNLRRCHIATTATLGIDPDWVEAIAFAWLAKQTLDGRPGNLAAVTGAGGERVLGAIYPA